MSENATTFSFLKGGEDILSSKEGEAFNWEDSASTVRGQLANAMNARNVAFLLGSGCSSYFRDDQQVGISTMAPMAKTFLDEVCVFRRIRTTIPTASGRSFRSIRTS